VAEPARRQPGGVRTIAERQRRQARETRCWAPARAALGSRPSHHRIRAMTFDLADRGIYGFATSEHLRFADLDANGHINNGAFIELLENARVSYLRRIVRRYVEKGGLP